MFMGVILVALSAVAAVVYTVLFFFASPPPGITTLIILTFLGIGLNSLGIGVLGEYIGRTYAEVKRRPLYMVEEGR